jgi:hypothetical protein
MALTSGLSNLAWKEKSKTGVRLARWQLCVWRSGKLGRKGQMGAVRSNDWNWLLPWMPGTNARSGGSR